MNGVVVWFTGLPASGKTTLARAVHDRLAPYRSCVLLDSDELRDILGASTYKPTARDAFYAVLADLATMLARQGHVVLVAATAPRRVYRDRARTRAPRFVEVWVQTSLAECEARDPKHLYARARAGQAPTLPGVGEAYEPPLAADVTASGGHDRAAVDALVDLLLGVS